MVAAGVVALALSCIPAVGQDRAVELLSTGPTDAGTLADVTAVSVSDDAATVAFLTTEQLVQSDQDSGQADVYIRRGATTTIASQGETISNGPNAASQPVVSQDGSRVFFTTDEKLTSDDDDAVVDVYVHAGATTTLVSKRDPNLGGTQTAVTLAASLPAPTADRAILQTATRLLVEDGDAAADLYEAGPAGMKLLTPGTTAAVRSLDANRALTHVYFGTEDPLISATDNDSASEDIYLTIGGESYKHVTRGPTAQSSAPAPAATVDVTRPDGLAVVIKTDEALDAGDTDGTSDVYVSAVDGPVTWISRAAGQGCPSGKACNALTYGASSDLDEIAFTTDEPLLASDTDNGTDLYLSENGAIAHVSAGPSGGNGSADIAPVPGGRAPKVSPDGRGVIFTTAEGLVPEDTDTAIDLYERIGGILRLVSIGEIGATGGVSAGTGTYRGGSAHVLFTTATALLRADVDSAEDLYVRSNDRLELVTPGRETFDASGVPTTTNANLTASSLDGSRILFRTREQLIPADHDEGRDLYSALSTPGSVVPPPPGRDVEPPQFAVRVTRATFRATNRRATIASARSRRRRTPAGTTIEFTLSEPARTNFSFSLAKPGRLSGGRCRVPARRLRRAKRCTRYSEQPGRLGFDSRTGKNVAKFYGRIGSRRLKAGPYVMFGRAYDAAGNASALRSVKFRVARR